MNATFSERVNRRQMRIRRVLERVGRLAHQRDYWGEAQHFIAQDTRQLQRVALPVLYKSEIAVMMDRFIFLYSL